MHYNETAHELGQKYWVGATHLQNILGRELYGIGIRVNHEIHGKKLGHELHLMLGDARLARLPIGGAPEGAAKHATVNKKIFFSNNKTVDEHFKETVVNAIKKSHQARMSNEL